MSGIEKFLSHKLGFNQEQLSFSLLMKIAGFEHISVDPLPMPDDTTEGSDGMHRGMICWGSDGQLEIPLIYLRTDNKKVLSGSPSEWFTLAHELAHFYLHPFLRYLKGRTPYQYAAAGNPLLAEAVGYTQMEADQWAVKVFLPEKNIADKFELPVLMAMFSKDASTRLSKIRDEIYDFCLEETEKMKQLWHAENTDDQQPNNTDRGRSKEIEAAVARNLRLRAQDYIDEMQKRFILAFGHYPGTYSFFEEGDDQETQVDKIEKAIRDIRDVYINYEEKNVVVSFSQT